MTICVGILCSDGIVLAADTQESYGEEKSYVAKLFPVGSATRNMVIAGSGLASFIDYAKDKIIAIEQSANTPNDFEVKVRELMNVLYRDEFKLYPCDESHKGIELLISVQFGKAFPVLLHVDSMLVRRVHDARAIGAGIFTPLAQDFYSMRLTTGQGVWACMYIVREAKARYEGIGGSTHIVTLSADGFQLERSWDIAQREQILSRMDVLARRLLISMIPATMDGMLNASIQSAAELLRVTRKELQTLDKQFEKAVKMNAVLADRSRKRISRAAENRIAKQKEKSEP